MRAASRSQVLKCSVAAVATSATDHLVPRLVPVPKINLESGDAPKKSTKQHPRFLVPATGAHPPTSRPINELLCRWLPSSCRVARRWAIAELPHRARRAAPRFAPESPVPLQEAAATVRPRARRRTPGAARLGEDTAVLHGTYSRLPVRRGTRDARSLHTRARALQVPFKYTLDF